jgi:hypothetical protein
MGSGGKAALILSLEKRKWKCGPCPVFASYALEFALQLRKKHGETSVRVTKYRNNEQ